MKLEAKARLGQVVEAAMGDKDAAKFIQKTLKGVGLKIKNFTESDENPVFNLVNKLGEWELAFEVKKGKVTMFINTYTSEDIDIRKLLDGSYSHEVSSFEKQLKTVVKNLTDVVKKEGGTFAVKAK